MNPEKRTEKVRIIGVPMDLGAGRRGVDMGPSALRIAELSRRIRQLGIEVEDARLAVGLVCSALGKKILA